MESFLDPARWRAAAGEGGELSADERRALAGGLRGDPAQAQVFALPGGHAERAVEERLRWLPRAVEALRAAPLVVAGFEERIALSGEQLFRFHLPLAQLLADRAERAAGRFLVAIVGVPGGGKSVFAALMERVLGVVEPALGLIALGIDGYHYPNAYLDSHSAPEEGAGGGGMGPIGPIGPRGLMGPTGRAPLRAFKGAPFTYDAARLAADLRRVREGTEAVALPAYDRTLHDPVEGRLVVRPDHRLVLVEGNWLLHRADGWDAVGRLFDLSLFLDLPPGANREPLLARHRRGGRTASEALEHFDRVDRPNTERVAATRAHADIVIELDARHAIRCCR